MPPPQEKRPWYGILNHHHPRKKGLIKSIKALYLMEDCGIEGGAPKISMIPSGKLT